jgi:hypothetical protein
MDSIIRYREETLILRRNRELLKSLFINYANEEPVNSQ